MPDVATSSSESRACDMRATFVLGVLLCVSVGGGAADHYHPDVAAPSQRNVADLNPAEQTAEFWYSEAQAALEQRLSTYQNMETARNVIMFLGDGLSVPTLAAARALLGQRQGRPGEEARLEFETFPTVGLAKTYCVDAQIADSACTATAYLCGAKANYGTLGVSGAVPRYDCAASQDPLTHVRSIAEWALDDGRDVGLVTTTRVTHASPAGLYAKSANRNWENDAQVRAAGHDPALCPDIAHQLLRTSPGNRFKVILGGGRRQFRSNETQDEEGTWGLRTDGRDLIEEWKQEQAERNVSHAYVSDRAGLLAAPQDARLLGLFEGGHMQYHLEAQAAGADTEPTLAELTQAAIERLAQNERGYFLFVEGGRIDHAHHENLVHLALDETLELSAAVSRARQLAASDTLLVLTADHAHVMSFSGYSHRGTDVLGLSDQWGGDDIPYLTLSYANGPGHRPHLDGQRHDVSQESDFGDVGATQWPAHADVPLSSETHGADDVAVFALGPRHHMFSGLYEQSQLPHLMGYAACFGPGRHACDELAPEPEPGSATRLATIGTAATTLLVLVAALWAHF